MKSTDTHSTGWPEIFLWAKMNTELIQKDILFPFCHFEMIRSHYKNVLFGFQGIRFWLLSRHQIDLQDRGSFPYQHLKDINIIFYNFDNTYKLIGYYLKRYKHVCFKQKMCSQIYNCMSCYLNWTSTNGHFFDIRHCRHPPLLNATAFHFLFYWTLWYHRLWHRSKCKIHGFGLPRACGLSYRGS